LAQAFEKGEFNSFAPTGYTSLLWDNRLLGAELRAFKIRPGPISSVFKSAKYVSREENLFKSQKRTIDNFLRPARANLADFPKKFRKFKAFGANS
jgi:hypothetical protein